MNGKSLAIVLLSTVSVCAAPAMALTLNRIQAPSSVVSGAGQSVSSNLDQIVCRNEAPPTGSRIGGWRECETQRYWNGIPYHIREMILYGGR
jgi:hypothetical protein